MYVGLPFPTIWKPEPVVHEDGIVSVAWKPEPVSHEYGTVSGAWKPCMEA
jgi:hypothetical protein